TVKSVSPVPNERQDSANIMKWSRTQDLVSNTVSIVLTSNGQTGSSPSNGWQFYAIVVPVIAIGVSLSLIGFFMFKKRKRNATSDVPAEFPIMSEEDKVLKILKSFGGSVRQSEITNQSRFSKAKTSQLLAALEKKGSITRYKSGRDKIVTLKERVKSE
ncbi:MAG TPA: MarR family transcriptional regulator, partial [Candidatus Bathyarchaeia archaeon]